MKIVLFTYIVLTSAISTPCLAKDLKSSLDFLHRTNPSILMATESLRAQNEAYVQARAAFGPQVSINFETDYQQARIDQTSLFGQKYQSSLIGRTATTSLDITQPLFSGGRLTAQATGAETDILAAREAARMSLSQSFREAIRTYSDVVRDGAILAATKRARDLLEHDLSDLQEKLKAGAAAVSDRAQVLARLSGARAQVASADGQFRQSRAAFLGLFGQEPADLTPPSHLPALPSTREMAVAGALAETPSLRQAIFEEASARAKVALARSGFSPDVSVRLAAQSTPSAPYVSNQQNRSLTAGLVVQVPIFNGGATRSKLRQAESQDRSARLKVESARRSAVQAAEQAFASFDTTARTVELLSEQVRADRVAYESLDEQFKSGLISTIDLLNAEQELANADIALAGARHDAVVSEADLQAATGRLEADVLLPDADPRYPEGAFRGLRIVASRLPTTLLVRELDSLATGGRIMARRVAALPLEARAPADRAPDPLDDIDPARVDVPASAPSPPQPR